MLKLVMMHQLMLRNQLIQPKYKLGQLCLILSKQHPAKS